MTLRLAITLSYVALLLGASLMPMPVSPTEENRSFFFDPSVQNLLHIPAYAVLSFLLASLFTWSSIPRFHVMGMIVIIALVVGIIMELVQIPIPGRYTSFQDIILNCIGIIAGMAGYYIFVVLYQYKLKKK